MSYKTPHLICLTRLCISRFLPACTVSPHFVSVTVAFFKFLLCERRASLLLWEHMPFSTTEHAPILFVLPGRSSASLPSLDLVYATSFFRSQLHYIFLDKPSLTALWTPSVPVICPHILLLVSFVSYSTIILKRLSFTLPMPVFSTRIYSREASLFYLTVYSQGIIQYLAQSRHSLSLCSMKE